MSEPAPPGSAPASGPSLIAKVIARCAHAPWLTLLFVAAAAVAALFALQHTRLDAIPDLSDAQVIVFTEFAGPELDGIEFARSLRRSGFAARRCPLIMVTAEATPTSIIGARNAGVHEFLRKPYTAGDLFRRIENVITKPRDWIEAQMYIGPDRRRFNSGEFAGARKRRANKAEAVPATTAA